MNDRTNMEVPVSQSRKSGARGERYTQVDGSSSVRTVTVTKAVMAVKAAAIHRWNRRTRLLCDIQPLLS
ncbi:MAG: hypothetical protein ACRCYQ_15850, partial [Nocardioides sp.]